MAAGPERGRLHRWHPEAEAGHEVCPGEAPIQKVEEGLQAVQLIGVEAHVEGFAKAERLCGRQLTINGILSRSDAYHLREYRGVTFRSVRI